MRPGSTPTFALNTSEARQDLNNFLACHSYVTGHTPTQADEHILQSLTNQQELASSPTPQHRGSPLPGRDLFPHLTRWRRHVQRTAPHIRARWPEAAYPFQPSSSSSSLSCPCSLTSSRACSLTPTSCSVSCSAAHTPTQAPQTDEVQNGPQPQLHGGLSLERRKLKGRDASPPHDDSTALVKRKVGRRQTVSTQIPADIVNDPGINDAISKGLPKNYNFEIHKTVWRLRETNSHRVALQFPEGLLMYACIISDILERFAGVEALIMGDVTYGACCVDDFTAIALGCDFMVHYGHSCLVRIDVSKIKMLYVFVDMHFDVEHLVSSLKHNFAPEHRVIVSGTIQFAAAIQTCQKLLEGYFAQLTVPQAKPLSRGEVLGCTAPRFEGHDMLIFVADGRFHLESIMIQNPEVAAFYKYNPYDQKLTLEHYDHKKMHAVRRDAIQTASKAKTWGVILGTLGRQGNPHLFNRITSLLESKNLPYIQVLLSEVFPAKLAMFPQVDAWIQVACPRLSIDWGYAFHKPLLSAYEVQVALKEVEWQPVYPMDFYRKDAGPWGNYYKSQADKEKDEQAKLEARAERAAKRKARLQRNKGKTRGKVAIAYDSNKLEV